MTRSARFLIPTLVGFLWIGCSTTPTNMLPPPDDVVTGDAPGDTAPVDSPATDTPQSDTPQVDAPSPDVAPPDAVPVDATPDVATPDAADAAVDLPTTPDAMDVLDVPPTPDVPVVPDIPDVMDVTDRPDVTDVPSVTDRPDVPPLMDVPVVTDRPDVADAAPCIATAETCNGRDDDCDGLVDESSCGTHLLVTEVVVTPTAAEFIEVHNPTSATVNLSNYYLSDMHDYACVLGRTCTITGRTAMTLASSDFVVRFPDGATIPAGGHVVISIASPADFAGSYPGRCPNFYVPSRAVVGDAGTGPLGPCAAAVPMRPSPATTSSIGVSAGLGNEVELAMLFRWDGAAALATDVDYVFWGTASATNAQVDKSGTSVMGTMYRPDTPAAMQQRIDPPGTGSASVRCNFAETGERRTGGNGVDGHDETSEPLNATWRFTNAAVRPDGGTLVITATPGALNDCR